MGLLFDLRYGIEISQQDVLQHLIRYESLINALSSMKMTR